MALPININELLNGRTVEWERIEVTPQDEVQNTPQDTPQAEDTPQDEYTFLSKNKQAVRVLEFCTEYKQSNEIMSQLGLSDKKHFRKKILKPLIEFSLLEMSLPEKPKSPKQKYKTTEKGVMFVKLV